MPEELIALNRATVGDGYSEAATLRATTAKRLTIFVYNNSVLYQLALDNAGLQWGLVESELPPGFHSLSRACSGIRFRNFQLGSPGIVTAKLIR